MPVYVFEGRREQTGEPIRGVREAISHAALGQDLLSEGVLLTRYALKSQPPGGVSFLLTLFKHVPIIERAMFARYFALMLRAGLDTKRALVALSEQTGSRSLKAALVSVYQDVERGRTLAESLQPFPYAFPALFVSFVQVGETTGRLQESLEVLAEQLEKEYQLNRAVRGGLLYPVVIVLVLIAVAVAMMFFVVPKLVEVFAGFNVELPLPTRILIGTSNFFQAWWPWLMVGSVAGAVGLVLLLRLAPVRAAVLHLSLLSPVIGPIMQKVNLARFARNLSSLLQSGVSFLGALDVLGSNTPHPTYAKVLTEAREYVKQGKELSAYLAQFKRLFPSVVVNVVKVGEETGSLDKVLKEIALFYEREVDQTMKNLTSVMEPVLMVLMGLAVGALAVSVISPIYDLVNVI
ncbi:MAG: type II secretion system F family protein [Candidatus Andersenbacteria bacterium]|nr:type II secretion system F family protein [Candidatus Andersenbacteria bacterium]